MGVWSPKKSSTYRKMSITNLPLRGMSYTLEFHILGNTFTPWSKPTGPTCRRWEEYLLIPAGGVGGPPMEVLPPLSRWSWSVLQPCGGPPPRGARWRLPGGPEGPNGPPPCGPRALVVPGSRGPPPPPP